MPFQLIWEYEEVFEIIYFESPWYYLSKTLSGSMIWKKNAGENSITKKVFCKLGSVVQTGYDYNAICVYLFVCLDGHLCVCDSMSL